MSLVSSDSYEYVIIVTNSSITTGQNLYLIDEADPYIIPNNSVILSDHTGRIPRLQCISGEAIPNTGHWVSPTGQDLNTVTDDPFSIVIGDESDPGYTEISLERDEVISIGDMGIYKCLLPGDDGANVSLHVGIYHRVYASKCCHQYYDEL